MPAFLFDIWNVVLMILGFSLVIVVHELGHFLAARWAGIRVHAFAVGFGQALVSFRKGLGVRVGSSEGEYNKIREQELEGIRQEGLNTVHISPTEYRINWIPFGGYVRMLGQEDGAPARTSNAPDSYTRKPVWKRMVVVSGGVIMNVILAALLFMVAFLVGITDVAPVVGEVGPGSPAAAAGFKRGDIVLSAGSNRVEAFSDVTIATAMSGPDEAVDFDVRRGDTTLTLTATPERDASGMKMVGVLPAQSTTLLEADRRVRDDVIEQFAGAGLEGARPGMTIVAANGAPLQHSETGPILLDALRDVAARSGGRPFSVTLEDEDGQTVESQITPAPRLNEAGAVLDDSEFPFSHVLGLTPLMKVLQTQPAGHDKGLRDGDVFLRIGDALAPSVPLGIETIRAAAGTTIPITVLRGTERLDLDVPVDDDGRIGFLFGHATEIAAVAAPPTLAGDNPEPLAASRIEPPLEPGDVVLALGRIRVANYDQVRDALLRGAMDTQDATDTLTFRVMATSALTPGAEFKTHTWTLDATDIASIPTGWILDPTLEAQFQFANIELRAEGPVEAIAMGVRKTHRIMMLTYLTFQRLFQGTVSPTELRGPVGITHIGSQYAAQGFVYLLFFLALISANLAVINFLPIPVVDGGLFIMLLIEGITRRPVPIVVQNVATIVGLALILTAFVFVTFNDIARFF